MNGADAEVNIMQLIAELKSYKEYPMHERALVIRDALLGMQLSDGGFAYMGEISDCDVTAMALQALAPYYKGSPEQTEADRIAEEALEFLSTVQSEDGSFYVNVKSIGKNTTSESTSQVIIALCELNIDFRNDERFIKSGNNVYDGLMTFVTGAGEDMAGELASLSHIQGSMTDKMSTTQGNQALKAIITAGYLDEEEILQDIEKCISETDENNSTEANKESRFESFVKQTGEELFVTHPYKSAGIGIILLLTLAYIAAFGRKSRKKLLSALVVAVAALIVLLYINIDSKAGYYDSITGKNGTEKVYMSITTESIKDTDSYKIYPSEELYVQENATVFDVLVKYCAIYDIALDYTGSGTNGSFVYIKGIDLLYEKRYGKMSGWMYKVNGEVPEVGCSSYTVKDEDVIEWFYTIY